MGTSVGTAIYEPGLSGEELLRRADVAMYAAKRMPGSSHTSSYNSELDQRRSDGGRIIAELKRALAEEALDVAYSPIFDQRGDLVGAEASLHWVHPELGPIAVDRVFEMAATAGIVDRVNQWFFETAMADVAALDLDPDTGFYLFVDVAPVAMRTGTVAVAIRDALVVTQVDPARVLIQFDELVAAEFDDAALAELAVGGARLAVHGFGRSREGLARFREIPVFAVSIFPLLVQMAVRSTEDFDVFDAVVRSARSVADFVVVDGVEIRSHGDAAVRSGVDGLKGHGLCPRLLIGDLRQQLECRGMIGEPSSSAASRREAAARGDR